MRSILFVPGDSEKKLAKAASIAADVLALDLEDSVTPAKKPEARERVQAYLRDRCGPRRQQLWVRINPLDSAQALQDLAAVMAGRPDGIIQPKIFGLAGVQRLSHYLDALEAHHNIETGATRIIAVATETADAMLTLRDYVGERQPRLAGLIWGAEDLATAIGAATNKADDGDWGFPYQLARANCLFAAHAAGVAAIDTMYGDLRDEPGLRTSCERARRDGFAGKVAIHPAQVQAINAAFTSSEDDLRHARRVVAAFEEADSGTVDLDGQMLDIPHLKQARRIIEFDRTLKEK